MIKKIEAKSLVVKSNLPAADYVINPYLGCTHGCIYCYAVFMKRFYKIENKWGEFVFEKNCNTCAYSSKLDNKVVLMSSVTDPYQGCEKYSKKTRGILKDFIETSVNLEILTKSDLVIRDIDIIRKISNAKVGISISSNDNMVLKIFEPRASSYEQRINALQVIRDNNIQNYLFISPILPFITNWKKIIDDNIDKTDLFMFENLNCMPSNKEKLLHTYEDYYPAYFKDFEKIVTNKIENTKYWNNIQEKIEQYCNNKNIKYIIFFNHTKEKK